MDIHILSFDEHIEYSNNCKLEDFRFLKFKLTWPKLGH